MQRSARSFVAACVLAAGTLASITTTASAQVGTAITYQGVLERNNVKVNTATDMRFTLFTAASGGSQVGNVVTLDAQNVSNGLFNVALDFGVNPYTADAARWMQIEVRNPTGSGNFVPMGARQRLTPAPFSLATRGMTVDANGSPRFPSNFATFGDGTIAPHLTLDDIPNASWQLFTANFQLNFLNDNGGTFNSKMTLTNTGNVGIGTTAPSDRLHVKGGRLRVDQTDGVGGSGVMVMSNGTTDNYIYTAGPTGNLVLDTQSPADDMILVPGGGDVAIGNITPTARLDVAGSIRIRTSDLINFGGDLENSDPIWIRRRNDAPDVTVLEMRIGDNPGGAASSNDALLITAGPDTLFQFNTFASGGFAGQALKNGGGAWANLSDARAKHDIAPLTDALDRLMALQGRTYFYNDPKALGAGTGKCTGFVAQEVELVFPEWIGTMADGTKTLSITGFEALTVESLRSLRAEKDAEIADLSTRLEKLEALLGQAVGNK